MLLILALLAAAPVDAGDPPKALIDVTALNLGLESIVSVEIHVAGETAEVLDQVRVATNGTVKKAKAFACDSTDGVGWSITIVSLGQSGTITGDEECKPGQIFQLEWGFDVALGKMTAGAVWMPRPKPKKK